MPPSSQKVGFRAYGGSNVYTTKDLEDMNPQEYQEYLNRVRSYSDRDSQLRGLTKEGGTSKTTGGLLSDSSSSSTTGLFGGGGIFGNTGLNDITDRAKDLAKFRLGLDKEQAQFSGGLRETEAQNNFGRQTKLVDQDYGWQSRINTDTQSAQTDRLQRELDTRKFQQKEDINQQNLSTNRAISLASRRLGAR